MRTIERIRRRVRLWDAADSKLGIRVLGHREFVGGMWDEIGELQRDLLIREGLMPHDVLLDVGCGALRGGRLFIPYLDPGHYIGIDQYPDLVERGLTNELTPSVVAERQPRFVYTSSFDLGDLRPRPTFALALSLFTHLTRDDAELCLRNVRAAVADGCRFFVTFFEADQPVDDGSSHSHRALRFTRSEMEEMGNLSGWDFRYIGEWGHPRGQQLVEYVAKRRPE